MSSLALGLFFLFSCFTTLTSPLFSIPLPLFAFSPYLILTLYYRPFRISLRHAFLCGLILDLLSSSLPLGFFAFILMLCLTLFYRFKSLFFIDKILTLPILTFLFSIVMTLTHRLALNIFCTKSPLTLKWIGSDLVLLPLVDALFAFVFFALPHKFFSRWLSRDQRKLKALNLKTRT